MSSVKFKMDLFYELGNNERREKPEPKEQQIFKKKEGTMKSRNNKTLLQWIILFEVFFFNLKKSNQTKDRYVRLQTKSKIHSNTNEIGLCLYHCKIFIFIL